MFFLYLFFWHTESDIYLEHLLNSDISNVAESEKIKSICVKGRVDMYLLHFLFGQYKHLLCVLQNNVSAIYSSK